MYCPYPVHFGSMFVQELPSRQQADFSFSGSHSAEKMISHCFSSSCSFSKNISCKIRNRNIASRGKIFAVKLYKLNLMQGVSRQIGFPSGRASDCRNILNDQQFCALAVTPGNMTDTCIFFPANVTHHNCLSSPQDIR